MWVKICANTNLADAQLAAELGADAVGFVFAPSKRQVTVEQAAAITRELPDTVEKVGVFSALDAATLATAALEAGLTALQLHRSHDPALVQELNAALEAHVKLIQVVKVPVDSAADEAVAELKSALRDPGLYGVLLDAAKAGASGGLGVAFSWGALAPEIAAARLEVAAGPMLIVAGGLDAGNVRTAIAALRPDGVDVASGVEAAPGKKSPERMKAFLEAVRVSVA